jgi:hypothetical protein
MIGKKNDLDLVNLDLNNNRSFDGVPLDANFTLAAFDPTPDNFIPGNFAGTGVDSVARYVASTATYIDLNSNFAWDGNSGGDRSFFFAPGAGMQTPLAGDWGMIDKDAWGIYAVSTDEFRLDVNDNGVFDGNSGGDFFFSLASVSGSGTAFAGDFTGNGGSSAGKLVAPNNNFIIDLNGNGVWDGNGGGDFNGFFAPGMTDSIPLVGNWDGSPDGSVEIGVYSPTLDQFALDLNANKVWDGNSGGDLLVVLAFASGNGIPGVCDFNGDGADDVYKVVGDVSNWIIDLNGNGIWDGNSGGDFNGFFGPASGTGVPMAGYWTAP